jgi:hypothetical protein
MKILKQALQILAKAELIGDISEKITISLDKLEIWLSSHGQERLYRHENDQIKETEIISTVKKALSYILSDLINGKISNNSHVLITNSMTKLNIIGALELGSHGHDIFEVITIMRKENFKPKENTSHYVV